MKNDYLENDILISSNFIYGDVKISLNAINELIYSLLDNSLLFVSIINVSSEINKNLLHIFIKVKVTNEVDNLNNISNHVNTLINNNLMNVLKIKPKNISIFFDK